MNEHFTTVGNRLADNLLTTQTHHLDYVDKCKSTTLSFLFQPVLPDELRLEILLVPNDKSYYYIHTEIYTLKSRRLNFRSQTDVN